MLDILKALASSDKSTADYVFAHITLDAAGMTKTMDRLGVASRSSRGGTQQRANWPPTETGTDGREYAVDNFGRTFLVATGEEVFYKNGEAYLGAEEGVEGVGIGPQGEIVHFFPSQQMKILKGMSGG
jgi:hypothetical protein